MVTNLVSILEKISQFVINLDPKFGEYFAKISTIFGEFLAPKQQYFDNSVSNYR